MTMSYMIQIVSFKRILLKQCAAVIRTSPLKLSAVLSAWSAFEALEDILLILQNVMTEIVM